MTLDEAKVRVETDWEVVNLLVATSPSYRKELTRITESIADLARRKAKEYDSRNPSYSPSFTAALSASRLKPYGYVYASRHEMVNEFGWTDLAGKHHPGRFVFRRALRSHRITARHK